MAGQSADAGGLHPTDGTHGIVFPVSPAGGRAPAMLAFSTGGLAGMALIGLALGVDVAFIATHQVIRIFLVILLAPAAIRLWRG